MHYRLNLSCLTSGLRKNAGAIVSFSKHLSLIYAQACTKWAVSFFTKGNTSNNVGKAISHDKPQADNQSVNVKASIPKLFRVLTKETIKVIRIDNSKGIISPAALAGNLGIGYLIIS